MVNTTLDYSLFDYTDTCTNLTFMYGCPPFLSFPESSRAPCNGNNNVVHVFPGNMGPGQCNASVIVTVLVSHENIEGGGPVNQTEMNQSVLLKGFDVRWKIDSQVCNDCTESMGRCGFDYATNQTTCLCPDPPYVSNRTCMAQGAFPPIGPPPSGSKRGLSVSVLQKFLIIGFTFGIFAIVILSTVCCLKRRHLKSGRSPESNKVVEIFLLEHGSIAPRRYNYDEIKKITKSFKEKLGKGGYGSVYKGTLTDGRLVAVKILIETNSTNGEEFINEVASISRTSHVNIVNLFGFCFHKNKRALVYEFMPNKSLDKYICTSNTDCNLDLARLYNIALGVARGLEYLHRGCSTRIVHFDIKPQNILLDEDYCPKISDFGLAKLCKKKQSVLSSMTGTRGTIGYIAPEVFSRNFGGVSHKSDVYSYGMMVLEMAGERKITETEVTLSSENYFPDNIYKKVVLDEGNKLDKSMNEVEVETARKMFLVGFWCIQTTPSDRPSMSKVVEMLEGSLESIQIPPKPFLFTTNELSGNGLCSLFSLDEETKYSTES
ncbi:hypothetical protein RD792_001239 [Penstemon davidsonii]|uniref:Protein kinase domain-containing protein n=1 Tax=Penstemon davidsonii TaxID=160366 RepID=A0ABR0DMW1_9LAMI|nr:hypothetical protein RD792_001239 [Penstemon davidsonii]